MIKVKAIEPDGPIIEYLWTEKNWWLWFFFRKTNVLSKYDLILKEVILNKNVLLA